MRPQVFSTSGHAGEHAWIIGYGVDAGAFIHEKGQLFGKNSKGKRFAINSPEPKVYIAMGNCLIGHIDRPDCMVTAWIHSGGVYQMVGYTVPTWFGRMGWGTFGKFQSAEHNLAESFFWANQGIVRELHEKYAEFESIEFNDFNGDLAAKHKIVRKDEKTGKPQAVREALGLLWDRDSVAFYGDPAWDARYPKPARKWTVAWSKENGIWALTITPHEDGAGPGSISVFLPERLTHISVVEGAEFNPLVTDNFLITNLLKPEEYRKDKPVRIRLRGRKLERILDE